jgi:exopolysaccharide biosynthesis polyprenyl glycosylphosphotransferase
MAIGEQGTTIRAPGEAWRPKPAEFAPAPAVLAPTPTEELSAPPARGLRRDAVFRRVLIASDMVAALCALAVVAAAGAQQGLTWVTFAALPVVVLVAKLLGLYDRDELVFHKSTLDEAPLLFHLASLFTLGAWLLDGALVPGSFDRGRALILWGSFFALAAFGRMVARQAAQGVAPVERCLIIGPSRARTRFATKLSRAHRGSEVVGYLPLENERRRLTRTAGGERRRRNLSPLDVDRLIGELDVHRVVIIPGEAGTDTMLEAITRAKAQGVKVSILPRMFEVVGSSVEFDDLEGITVLGVRRFGLSRSSNFIKRSFDVAASGLVLVLLAPLMGLIALAIRLSSPGPVLFRQLRVGRGGDTFEMLKFRSMVDGADVERAELEALNESEGLFKLSTDPRVTPVGRLIRRASLDELPQLVNVLRGEMSLVGPRPLVPDEDRRIEGRHRGRLRLTPGMTGPWQLLGPTRVPLEDMVIMDYRYGANWSLWADLKILLRTLGHVFRRRGI